MKIRVIFFILIAIIALFAISGCDIITGNNTDKSSQESSSDQTQGTTPESSQGTTPEPSQDTTPEPTEETTPEPIQDTTPESTTEEPDVTEPDDPDDSGLVWQVEPTYEEVVNVFWAGKIRYDNFILDIATGEVSEWDGNDYATGGLAAPTEWLYDENKNLFGAYGTNEEYMAPDFKMFAAEDFTAFLEAYYIWDPNAAELLNRLRAIRKIDSDKVKKSESEWDWYEYDYDLSEAYIGDKFAVAYGTEFITDFIYDHDNDARTNNPTQEFIAIKSGGKWGVINKDGDTVVPFVLDDIIFSGQNTAFAKYDGKYGILEIG